MRKITSWITNISLLIVTILFCTLGAELVLRYFLPQIARLNPPTLFLADKTLQHKMAPDYRGEHVGPYGQFKVEITTNSLGLRGPEINNEKPSHTFRILVVGDSFTFGYGVPYNKTYPYVLQDKLNSSGFLQKKIEVVNAGVNGYCTIQERLLLSQLLHHYKFDMVILAFYVGNDIRENYSFETGQSIAERHKMEIFLPFKDFLRKKSHFYRFIRDHYIALLYKFNWRSPLEDEIYKKQPNRYVKEGWEITFHELNLVKTLAETNGTKFIVIIIPALAQLVTIAHSNASIIINPEEPQLRLSEYLNRNNIVFVDLLSQLKALPNIRDLYFRYNEHWNKFGHEAAANIIAKYILKNVHQ